MASKRGKGRGLSDVLGKIFDFLHCERPGKKEKKFSPWVASAVSYPHLGMVMLHPTSFMKTAESFVAGRSSALVDLISRLGSIDEDKDIVLESKYE